MSYEGPKTVTFGASPQDEAQHRSARLGSRVIGATLGVAAIALTLVACAWALNFAASLAASWGETVKLGSVALALTLALTGLPVASAMLSRSYPVEARRAMQFWLTVLTIAAGSMIVFVAQLAPQDRAAPELDNRAARIEAGVSDIIWRYSKHCKEPENEGQRDVCMAFESAMQHAEAPGDWSPRNLFAITPSAGDGPMRRVLVLAMGVLAIIGAALLGRIAVLSMSESYRLGYGQASALPANAVPQLGAEVSAGGAGAMTPADIFSLWANSRLVPAQGKAVQSQLAYEDYAQTCRMNFVEPLTLTKFGTLMTSRAEASAGRITKEKSQGLILYRGWALASDMGSVGGGAPVAQIPRK